MDSAGPRSGTDDWLDKRRAALDAIPPVERSLQDGTLRVTRRFRGLDREQALGYLEHLGGERRGDAVEGEGWRATLSTRRVPVGPSYRLTEVTVTWTGEEATVDRVVTHFRLKAFRAPG
ncbi:MAG: hypothetical protein ABEJ23_07185 [Haloarculaceae archaeon]